jgi:hypothetical protein
MKEWKIRQDVYHKLGTITDTPKLMNEGIVMQQLSDNDLILDIVRYMTHPEPRLLYPTKSYAVAIVYATLLEQHFGENKLVVLDDPVLLYENDPYFIHYSEAKHIYDGVLSKLPILLNWDIPQLAATKSYFLQEFIVGGV